jgi:hypothetical protein
MAKPPLNQEHADNARRAIAACNFDPHTVLKDTIKDILVDIGHLCDAENIDFVAALKRALNTWAVERIDPHSVLGGPIVEIIIGTEGLPEKPKPVRRPTRRDKSRPA